MLRIPIFSIRNFEGHTNVVSSVAFSPDSKYIISGSSDNTIKLWDLETLKEIKTELEKHPDIKDIHHIHSWRLSDNIIHFQCHADVNKNLPIKDIDKIRIELENTLHKGFGIDHITIQMELDTCSEKSAIVKGN